MRKILFGLIFITILCFSANASFGSIVLSIEDVNVLPGTTSVSLDLNISGITADFPVDSISIDLVPVAGLSLANVTFGTLPSGWSNAQNTSILRFGAWNPVYPGTTATTDFLPFATLSFDIDPAYSILGSVFTIDFLYVEIIDPDLMYYDIIEDSGSISVVPIPAAAWLLGSGLLGLVALRRRRS